MQKRKEIYFELLYYIFDSLVIPLIRSNFHVTESANHRNRLFYFRHDVWRAMAEPALTDLRMSMFQEIPIAEASKMLDARTLGFSQIRLLPKAKGARPIINLRRRINRVKDRKSSLGRSINSVIQPVFSVLDYARKMNPTSIGSALFSVGDMYIKLKAFRYRFMAKGESPRRLFFAKCDVQGCFDTLPQQQCMIMARQLIEQDEYDIYRHAEIRALDGLKDNANPNSQAKCAKKFVSRAQAATDFEVFSGTLQNGLANGKRNTVFVDSVLRLKHQKAKLLALLEEHVQNNMLKIGKKFYRQESGIPQGSVLSTLLCNFVYAGLEREKLGFLRSDESILLRLVDDFLLITANETHAKMFLQIMHAGVEKYGVKVNPTKSIANFKAVVNGVQISIAENEVPYCGNLINTRTLEVTKDRQRRKDTGQAARWAKY